MPRHYTKDPQALLDYWIDWGPILGADTIETSSWIVEGTVTKTQEAIYGQFTQVWVSGGVVGELVLLTNHITTGEGREDDRTLSLSIRER